MKYTPLTFDAAALICALSLQAPEKISGIFCEFHPTLDRALSRLKQSDAWAEKMIASGFWARICAATAESSGEAAGIGYPCSTRPGTSFTPGGVGLRDPW